MSADERGVYRKFEVHRTDGSDGEGGKHQHCRYFVLDLDHDEHARAALGAYAEDCREQRPELADDIDEMLAARSCGCRSVGECWHSEQGAGDVLERMMRDGRSPR